MVNRKMLGEGADYIEVQACKPFVRQWKFTQRWPDLIRFDGLTGVAGFNKFCDIFLEFGPILELTDSSASLFWIGMSKSMECLGYYWSQFSWDHGSGVL